MKCNANSEVRHTLGVMAQSDSDAVVCAGGAIYDWTAAGWDVTVYVPGKTCSRAIDIVGAQHGDLESLLNQDASLPRVLVITTALLAANGWVKARVEQALAARVAEVLFVDLAGTHDAAYGDGLPRAVGSAAYAFKKRAIQATGVQIDAVGTNEHFCWPAVAGPAHLLNFLQVKPNEKSAVGECDVDAACTAGAVIDIDADLYLKTCEEDSGIAVDC